MSPKRELCIPLCASLSTCSPVMCTNSSWFRGTGWWSRCDRSLVGSVSARFSALLTAGAKPSIRHTIFYTHTHTHFLLVFQESRETGQHFTTAKHGSITRNKLKQTFRGQTSITYKLVYAWYNQFCASPLFLVTWKHRWRKRESGKARRKVGVEWLLSMVLNGCPPCVCEWVCVCSQTQLLVTGLTWLLNTQKQICFHQNSLTWQGRRGLHWSFFLIAQLTFKNASLPFFFSLNKILERVYVVKKKKDRNENDQILWRNWRDNVGHSGHSRYKWSAQVNRVQPPCPQRPC